MVANSQLRAGAAGRAGAAEAGDERLFLAKPYRQKSRGGQQDGFGLVCPSASAVFRRGRAREWGLRKGRPGEKRSKARTMLAGGARLDDSEI